MYKYKIDNIHFCDDTSVQPGALTLIVGPNNSGKSQILRDILSLSTGQRKKHPVVKDLDFAVPANSTELCEAHNITTHTDQVGNVYLRSLAANMTEMFNLHVGGENWKDDVDDLLKKIFGEPEKATFGQRFGNMVVSMLSTEGRLQIIKEAESADEGITEKLLHALYYEGLDAESAIREIVQLAFQKDVRLDLSTPRKVSFRIGDDLSAVPPDPREAKRYYAENKTERLDDQGDGIRSFVATVVTLLVGKRPVLLLDEPEAFLHPPQAFRLGEVVAEQARAGRQVFVATHSAEFLRGVLSRRQDVLILRVERTIPGGTIKRLESQEVATLAQDPLLSSTRVLDGLFYHGAIVVEADADSVFYQRVGRELTEADRFHVVHAHNKQTVAKVLLPYRSLGIRHATILDFDVMRVAKEFEAVLGAFDISPEQTKEIFAHRDKIVEYIEKVSEADLLKKVLQELEAELEKIKASKSSPQESLSILLGDLKRIRESGTAWKPYKKAGRAALPRDLQALFDELAEKCAQYGLFIVPVGELEGWLVQHGLAHTSNKSNWIVNALELLPKLNADANKEPWSFMQLVFAYLNCPQQTAAPK